MNILVSQNKNDVFQQRDYLRKGSRTHPRLTRHSFEQQYQFHRYRKTDYPFLAKMEPKSFINILILFQATPKSADLSTALPSLQLSSSKFTLEQQSKISCNRQFTIRIPDVDS
jgi:hypothetical protein